jgi:hypothetical protein
MAQIYGIKRSNSFNNNWVIFMAYRKTTKTTYGKAFRKKTGRGKFAKGTWIKYAYKNGKRVGTVRSKK